jgi:hypothetical protein
MTQCIERDRLCRFYYLKAACLRRIKPVAAARCEKFFRAAIGELSRTLKQPHPSAAYALCELGELFVEENKHDDARRCWADAGKLRDFHWEKLLAQRLRAGAFVRARASVTLTACSVDLEKLQRKERGLTKP